MSGCGGITCIPQCAIITPIIGVWVVGCGSQVVICGSWVVVGVILVYFMNPKAYAIAVVQNLMFTV